jgi:hypothetical protein
MKDMSSEQFRASLLMVEAEMQGMIAENQDRERKGLAQAYGEEAFNRLADYIRQIKEYYS